MPSQLAASALSTPMPSPATALATATGAAAALAVPLRPSAVPFPTACAGRANSALTRNHPNLFSLARTSTFASSSLSSVAPPLSISYSRASLSSLAAGPKLPRTFFSRRAPVMASFGEAPEASTAAAAAAAGGDAPVAKPPPPPHPLRKNVTPEELKAALESSNPPIVIDVRSNEQYSEGHVPGAINVPHAELRDYVLKEAATLMAREVVTVCNTGGRSSRAAVEVAETLPTPKPVGNLLGGTKTGWIAAGFEAEK